MTNKFLNIYTKFINEQFPVSQRKELINSIKDTITLYDLGLDSFDIFMFTWMLEKEYDSENSYQINGKTTIIDLNNFFEKKLTNNDNRGSQG